MAPSSIAVSPVQHRLLGLRNTSESFDDIFLFTVINVSVFVEFWLVSDPLQVFRPLHPRSQRRRKPQFLRSRLRCRARVCWVSVPHGQPPPALSSLPALCLGTALLLATHPLQAVQGDPFPPQWLMGRYVYVSLSLIRVYLSFGNVTSLFSVH